MTTLALTLQRLTDAGITVCNIGVAALNYYHVPRALVNIELCVPEAAVGRSTELLSRDPLFEQIQRSDADFNATNEYQRGWPTFLVRQEQNGTPRRLVLFSDVAMRLAPLVHHLVDPSQPNNDPVSSHMQGLLEPEATADWPSWTYFPVPYLSSFIIGLASRYVQEGDGMARVAVEDLISSLDLNVAWWQHYKDRAPLNVQKLMAELLKHEASPTDEMTLIMKTAWPLKSRSGTKTVRDLRGFEGPEHAA